MIASVHVLSKELGKDFKAHYVLQRLSIAEQGGPLLGVGGGRGEGRRGKLALEPGELHRDECPLGSDEHFTLEREEM